MYSPGIGFPELSGNRNLAAIFEALKNPARSAQTIAGSGVGPKSLRGAAPVLPVLDPGGALQRGGMSDFANPNFTGATPAPSSVIPFGGGSVTPAGDLPPMAGGMPLTGSEVGDTLGGLLSGISELTTPPPLPEPPKLPTAPSGAVSGLGGPASTGNVAELLKLLQPGVGGPASLRGAIPSLAQLLGARR